MEEWVFESLDVRKVFRSEGKEVIALHEANLSSDDGEFVASGAKWMREKDPPDAQFECHRSLVKRGTLSKRNAARDAGLDGQFAKLQRNV
ncbi:hypothetical protein TM239_01740 [Bradyrhizobium sp. TM239]|nr:hypothetical protein TM239_01740 [Bradyrhizobium sp. TM239]